MIFMGVIEKTYTSDLFRMTFLVEDSDDGMRLDCYIGEKSLPFSRESIKKKIFCGEIIIEGRVGKQRPSSRIRRGEKILFSSYKKGRVKEFWRGKNLDIESLSPSLIFEDDDIYVMSRPPFMLTHPTGRHLFHCATTYLEERYGKTVHSIHRLDRETSGILLLGKNPQISQLLTREFENRRVRKCYFFIAKKNQHYHGKTSFQETACLASLSLDNKRVAMVNSPQGKKAVTSFVIIEDIESYVLGLAFPQTGRQHQIRIHAMLNGLPLLGDKLYLGNFEMFQRFKDNRALEEDYGLMELPRHALHAIFLNITYKSKRVSFMDTIPQDLQEWIKALSLDIQTLRTKISNIIKDFFEDNSKHR